MPGSVGAGGCNSPRPPDRAQADRQTTRQKRALVAVGNQVLTIAYHLLWDPQARFADLGSTSTTVCIPPPNPAADPRT